MNYICPICRGALSALGTSAGCPSGHSFDRAAAGYYNLLVGRGAGNHGDNPEMLKARAAFLESGHYSPLATRISELVLEYTARGGILLDVGCGEGYYTDTVERALSLRDGESSVLAFDISKDAARRAAKRNKNISVAVASAYAMPLADGSTDTVLNIFSPLALPEVTRVLRTGGKFIMAFPAEEHLFGLKAAVYDTPYKNKPESPELEGLDLIAVERVHYTLSLRSAEEINALFMMTPYAYRTPPESRARLLSMSSLETEVEFVVFVYQKP